MLPDTCDFCELPLSEDEELTEVRLGSQPDPKPIFEQAIGPRGGYSASREAGKLSVLRKALHESEHIELKESDTVHEVEFGRGTEIQPVTENQMSQIHPADIEHRQRSDKVAAEIIIRPKTPETKPDAMFCEQCAAKFRNLG